ncbi:MAG: response regulator transcription factor [Spirochaetales bacterium]|nr:response regulator transcription factor [Spirochaetales bacterium]
MNGHVLVIEDEPELADLIKLYLEKEGMDVDSAGSAENALSLLESKKYDLLVLDINLPEMDGYEFLQLYRRNHSSPVIIVSARESNEDIVFGLGIGADEFVTKPFHPRVLVARIRALLRRSTLFNSDERNVVRFDPFELDVNGYILRKEGEIIPMTSREIDILNYLLSRAGAACSLQDIYDNIWDSEFGEITAVSVYIQRIRKKIEEDYRNPDFIRTIRGKGYLFNKEKLT